VIALDTTFLLDYLDGTDAAAGYLEEHDEEPLHAPSLSLFEVYRGAARTRGTEGVEEVSSALDWVEPLPIDDPAAKEASLIEEELLEDGERVNLGDTLIAGVCRHHGARIVTRDDHFGRVDGLDTETY